MAGLIENGRTRNPLTLWTVLVHVWVYILDDPQSVQLRNATTAGKKRILLCHGCDAMHGTSVAVFVRRDSFTQTFWQPMQMTRL